MSRRVSPFVLAVATALVLAAPGSAAAVSPGAVDPILTVPENIVVTAQSAQGAWVTYTVQATNRRGTKPVDFTCDYPRGNTTVWTDGKETFTELFPIGQTKVTCSTVPAPPDEQDEPAEQPVRKSFLVTVLPPPPPPAPPPPPPSPPPPPATSPPPPPPASPPPPPPTADETPPARVTSARAVAGNRVVRLTWRLPTDADLARVTIVRSSRGVTPRTVYAGTATAFRDGNVRNNVLYRYVIRSHDRSGNRSEGVAVSARPSALLSPAPGAQVTTPPVLRWAAIRNATYYNVQLWRDGKKIWSVWPSRTRLALRSSWTYRGRTYRLTAGRYKWFVWPGFGPRSRANYGRLLGSRTFVVVAS